MSQYHAMIVWILATNSTIFRSHRILIPIRSNLLLFRIQPVCSKHTWCRSTVLDLTKISYDMCAGTSCNKKRRFTIQDLFNTILLLMHNYQRLLNFSKILDQWIYRCWAFHSQLQEPFFPEFTSPCRLGITLQWALGCSGFEPTRWSDV